MVVLLNALLLLIIIVLVSVLFLSFGGEQK